METILFVPKGDDGNFVYDALVEFPSIFVEVDHCDFALLAWNTTYIPK